MSRCTQVPLAVPVRITQLSRRSCNHSCNCSVTVVPVRGNLVTLTTPVRPQSLHACHWPGSVPLAMPVPVPLLVSVAMHTLTGTRVQNCTGRRAGSECRYHLDGLHSGKRASGRGMLTNRHWCAPALTLTLNLPAELRQLHWQRPVAGMLPLYATTSRACRTDLVPA